MQIFYLDVFSALWLGILTSISPCPLATNIAAVSFVARNLGSSQKVLWSGVLYAAGRMLAYVAIAVLAVASLLSLPEVSFYLETHMHKIIGPLLIVVGSVLSSHARQPFFDHCRKQFGGEEQSMSLYRKGSFGNSLGWRRKPMPCASARP